MSFFNYELTVVKNFKTLLFTIISLAFSSCMDDSVIEISPIDLYGSRGVFIVNEGNYLYGNSSLSYYDCDSKEVYNDIFSVANGIPLGDVAYSMTIRNGKACIVVNNSGCIYVIDSNNLLIQKTVTGLTSPRHILFIDEDRALVSDLYGRSISIVNMNLGAIEGTIKTGGNTLPFYQHSTENLVRVGSKVYTNCWSYDNKILMVDLNNLSLADSITVGIQPFWMVIDKNENIWVVNDGGFAGNPFGHENPSLMRINTSNNTVELRLDFPSENDKTGQIAMNQTGDSILFIRNHLYKMDIASSELPSEPIFSGDGKNFRALSVDPANGDIYISDAIDFMSEGIVYQLSSTGTPIDTISAGITPTFFCFN